MFQLEVQRPPASEAHSKQGQAAPGHVEGWHVAIAEARFLAIGAGSEPYGRIFVDKLRSQSSSTCEDEFVFVPKGLGHVPLLAKT